VRRRVIPACTPAPRPSEDRDCEIHASRLHAKESTRTGYGLVARHSTHDCGFWHILMSTRVQFTPKLDGKGLIDAFETWG
jgi:hypothetical protein